MMTSAIELPARLPAPAAPEPLSVLPGTAGSGGLSGDVVAPGPAALEVAYPSGVAAERGASAAADAAANEDPSGAAQRASSGGPWVAAPERGSGPSTAQLSAYATAPGGDPAADAGRTPSPPAPGAGRARERERRIGAVAATSAHAPATHRRVVRREDDPRERDGEQPARDPSETHAGYTLDDIARFAGDDTPPGPFDTRSSPWHS
jgi:hypothetical protein